MKKVFTFIATVFLTATLLAQVPQKLSYQAVIRDADDNLITNSDVGIKFSILVGSENGTSIYTESITTTTNSNGLVSLMFGGGSGFANIDWGSSAYFLKTEVDPNGGNNYTISGTSQLLSVPYAFHAGTADNVDIEIPELEDYGSFRVVSEATQNIQVGTAWQSVYTLNITVDKPHNLHVKGFFRQGSPAAGIQIRLSTQGGNILDWGERSFRNPVSLMSYVETDIVFSVNAGTYIIDMRGSVTETTTVEDVYIEVLGIPATNSKIEHYGFVPVNPEIIESDPLKPLRPINQ